MDTSSVVLGLAALALLCETVVDVVKVRIPLPEKVAGYLWPLAALAVGIGLAFWANALISPLFSSIVSAPAEWADHLLAGLVIGGGASCVYDLLDKTSRTMDPTSG